MLKVEEMAPVTHQKEQVLNLGQPASRQHAIMLQKWFD